MPAGLDIKILRMLAAIDRQGSVTRAAAALGITQSALSHHIAETERRTGVRLFHRVNRRLHFTAIGEELLGAAKTIVAEVERLDADLALFREGHGPLLRFGSGAYGCENWLPRFIASLAKQGQQPDIEILDSGIPLPLLNAVIDGALDVAICGGDIDDRRVRCFALFEDELVGLLPAAHRLAGRAHLGAADFKDETFHSYSTVPEKGFEDEKFFRPAGVQPRRWVRTGNVAMIQAMVRQGLGVSILSRWAVTPALRGGGFVAKRLAPKGLAVKWQAVIRANEPADSAASQLAQSLQAWWSRSAPAAGRRRSVGAA